MAEIDDLFQAALGLAEPWQVVRSEFDATARRLDLHLDFPQGARFACPEGDQPACPVYDTQPRVILAPQVVDHNPGEGFADSLVGYGPPGLRTTARQWWGPGPGSRRSP